MQGRLVPKYQGRYQAFPIGMWKDEFRIAKECSVDLIEFILDFNDAKENPLLKSGGVDEITHLSAKTGISVKTICADYFMEAPLHSNDEDVVKESFQVLEVLLETAVQLNITDIVIPCVDQSSLETKEAVDRFIRQLTKIIPIIEKENINLSLETDLAPKPFVELLNRLNSNRITVNYDIGNSAALGFDSDEELLAYGDKITDIHIKDRVLGGEPVILGEGNADFKKFFDKLKEFNYQGPFIMQAYRDDEGVKIFKKQLDWIKSYINE
ncbi:MAG: sugar phosphate isomerase/epimerase family protein [Candidatus Endonucleobacter sp. (ex Gigantidas childressi)]|nr:sugar phosphate isomerase/epimerase family protein [Candidatus Endonucleobacter sp. (ex Gigantidas childressi)]